MPCGCAGSAASLEIGAVNAIFSIFLRARTAHSGITSRREHPASLTTRAYHGTGLEHFEPSASRISAVRTRAVSLELFAWFCKLSVRSLTERAALRPDAGPHHPVRVAVVSTCHRAGAGRLGAGVPANTRAAKVIFAGPNNNVATAFRNNLNPIAARHAERRVAVGQSWLCPPVHIMTRLWSTLARCAEAYVPQAPRGSSKIEVWRC